jgi:hypothetical protein
LNCPEHTLRLGIKFHWQWRRVNDGQWGASDACTFFGGHKQGNRLATTEYIAQPKYCEWFVTLSTTAFFYNVLSAMIATVAVELSHQRDNVINRH